ncbi:CaiB/BaiF CoA transferase family protein [Rhodopila sp.]|uniref:CaiB/BaiF CoA transferase family protein n=1 Tax=Rhodopila sp. TaxID=2480087 RepID=UPI002B897066|nr:CaiB/BaiF CoA-transferase family protein [Rhodopila sp.]HVZ06708.1 CaiB/BaiF CoA-transferase family protein [Rhodopila sp.]
MAKALSHIRVLDMSRVLAGPFLAQNLADLGADVIKIERPGHGDESRTFPPYLKGADGGTTDDSAYFSSVNRGKRSVTIDLATPQGQALVRSLAAKTDVIIENYRVGTLQRYGLDYESIRRINPSIIYCSITGFGQTGPYRQRPGYDYVFQAMSGLMSLTGERDDLPGGGPAKIGVAICDVITGIYSSFAVTAALLHRERTGVGQYIDMSLLDVQIAAISHINMNYLVSGKVPPRMGTAHPSIVPYQVFDGADGKFVLAVGNDGQFAKLCEIIGQPSLAQRPSFRTNVDRVSHRDKLILLLTAEFAKQPVAYWTERLIAAGVPCGPINDLRQVFADEHVRFREMQREIPHQRAGVLPILANPIRFSETPPSYDRAPPALGEHTTSVLAEELGLSTVEIDSLARAGVI